MRNKVLEVKGLKIDIHLDEGILTAVRGIDFHILERETVGLVGESGCGKSITCNAVLGINVKECVSTGEILFRVADEVKDILKLNPKGKEIRSLRGKAVSMVFQEPMTAFSPMYTIGNQINESTRLHITKDKAKSKEITLSVMRKVGISNVEKRYNQYPHEFSGGMLQRALIAMALICEPVLLIADEPTTALDVTIQAQILELMKEMQEEFGMSLLFVTHDLGVVAKMCDRVAVMYYGRIVEEASTLDVFKNPKHPYTVGLLGSIHKLGGTRGGELASIEGSVPMGINTVVGCSFYERCNRRIEGLCNRKDPPLVKIKDGHLVECFLYGSKNEEESI